MSFYSFCPYMRITIPHIANESASVSLTSPDMANLNLKTLLRSGALPAVTALAASLDLALEDAAGQAILGTPGLSRHPIVHEDTTLGWVSGLVTGPSAPAAALVTLITHLAAKESERRALAGEVLHLYREVHLIEQLSEQLAALLDFAAVGQSALDQARRLIAASHGGVLVMDTEGGPLRPVAAFGPEGALPADSPLVASAVERAVERGIAEIVNTPNGSAICAPLRAKQRTVGVISLGNDTGASYSSVDLKLLNTIALQTAAAIENSFLCAEMVDAVRDREQLAALQKELDTARTIQHSLVPRIFPPFPDRTDFDIHAAMHSAKAVGGDFFDFFLIDDDRLGLVIGDVSGKGIPAALYMAVTRTQIKTTALQGVAPAECLLEVNRVLVREKVSSMFATCFYGILHLRSGEFHFCNAGHNPPYLLRASGAVEEVPITGGLPLGMFAKLKCTAGSAALAPGDGLFLYTDGVPEAVNATLEDFTNERLVAGLEGASSLASRHLIDRITGSLLTFTAGAPQSDDITMLTLRLGARG